MFVQQIRNVLEQTLYSYTCPGELLAAIQKYAQNVPWEEVKRRGEKTKLCGRSYIHPSGSLQGVQELDGLHKWIEECFNSSRAEIGWRKETVRNIKISQTWLNRSDIGEHHHRHHHPLSLLSGILYITEHCSTRFMLPSIYALPRVLAPDKASGEMEIVHEFYGKKGQLVIFPSTLKHEVAPNLEAYARITLSINSWFSGSIGSIQELAYIPSP